ncbi:MAG: VC0807 family protein [Ktedonobacterales bacterium]
MSTLPPQDSSTEFNHSGNGRMNMRGMLPSILLNAVAPYILFQYLTASPRNVSVVAALSATAIFPIIGIAFSLVRTRHLDALGAISLVFIVIGLLTNLIFQDPKVFLIKESFITGALGLACLLSLVVTPRPAMFYLGRYFASGGDRERMLAFNNLWQYPSFRTTQRIITGVWGVTYLAEALIRVALVAIVGTGPKGVSTILAVSPILLGVVTIGTVGWTMWYVRRSVRKGAELRAARLAAQATR